MRSVLFATGVSIWRPALEIIDFLRPATEVMMRKREEGGRGEEEERRKVVGYRMGESLRAVVATSFLQISPDLGNFSQPSSFISAFGHTTDFYSIVDSLPCIAGFPSYQLAILLVLIDAMRASPPRRTRCYTHC